MTEKGTVLVIDDEDVMREILDSLLSSEGYRVKLASTGEEGFDITQSQEFRNQGYTKDQVDSVRMKRFTLTITSPQGADFDFIDSIAFYAESDGLPRVLVAELDPVPDGQSEIILDVNTEVELQPYVIAESMTITTEATGLRPEQETTVDANVVFDVDIAVTGACK